ncbi:MAG: sulfotransferase, partial [Rhizomicrobium sp.]
PQGRRHALPSRRLDVSPEPALLRRTILRNRMRTGADLAGTRHGVAATEKPAQVFPGTDTPSLFDGRRSDVTKQTPPSGMVKPFAVLRVPSGAGSQPFAEVDLLDPFRRARGLPLRPIASETVRPIAFKPTAPKTREEIAHLYEAGRTSVAMSFHELALETMEEVTRQAPDHAAAWRDYADLLRLAGKDVEAATADSRAIEAPAGAWPVATGERDAGKLERLDQKMRKRVEKIPDEQRSTWLREHLFGHPLDVAAMRYLANEEDQEQDLHTSEALMERALELSPGYLDVRGDYARLLMRKRDHLGAYRETAILLAAKPASFEFRMMRSEAAIFLERFDEAVALHEALLQEEPQHLNVLNAYGVLMKNLGRREAAERTFRSVLRVEPTNGRAYLGLSDLRSNRLNEGDVADMMRHLAAGIPDPASRKCMASALAQTLERMKEYEGAFEAYAFSAKVCKEEVENTKHAHDPDKIEERMARMRSIFTASLMSTRMEAPPPNPATTPIFVLGMPRAGSTLVEQILASHPEVEGTRELPSVESVTRRIGMSRLLVAPNVYPERVPDYSRVELHALGDDVLRHMALFRHTKLPYVIDKRPWNWIDIPFLALVLPQSRFIDIRRAPMAAGFAMFKQMLPTDASFSYDLVHIGRYYRTYVAQMEYFETIMPGRVLYVRYEDLIDNTEAEIRRMLDYCGLPFDERCLRFWETGRAVLTPSAEQVRKPIYRGAVEQWKNFEPWLGELKESLGDLANT